MHTYTLAKSGSKQVHVTFNMCDNMHQHHLPIEDNVAGGGGRHVKATGDGDDERD